MARFAVRRLRALIAAIASGGGGAPVVRRLVLAVLLLGSIFTVGTIGYMLLEGLALLDAVYMTVVTVSTVGFREVVELSSAGKVFTMFLILGGIGTASYSLATLAGSLIEGTLRDVLGQRSMKRIIEVSRNHVIVCGYGRLGRVVVDELDESKIDCVVVEVDESRRPLLEKCGHPYIIGSALDDAVLLEAGLERARAVVLATASESDAVFVTLSIREIRPDIPIHARAETDTGVRRLKLAGAAQVISPFHLGGVRIAQKIVRPAVVDFIELSRSRAGEPTVLEEIALLEGSPLDGVLISDLSSSFEVKVLILAIRRADQSLELKPGPNDRLRSGDRIVLVGGRESLARLAALAGPQPEEA